jgi:MFS family permease
LISKIVKKESSGFIFGVYFLFGTMGVLLINKLGGYLYDEVSHFWPFIIGLIVYIAFTVLTIIAGVLGKIKI